jgi:hypothetical protein
MHDAALYDCIKEYCSLCWSSYSISEDLCQESKIDRVLAIHHSIPAICSITLN